MCAGEVVPRPRRPEFVMVSAADEDVAYPSVVVPMYRLPPMLENSQCLRFDPAPESLNTRFLPVVVAIWRVANGVEVPRPRLPIELSQRNSDFVLVPKRTVDEAYRCCWSHMLEVVAAVVVPKVVVVVNGYPNVW
jgi:hypothetical protein